MPVAGAAAIHGLGIRLLQPRRGHVNWRADRDSACPRRAKRPGFGRGRTRAPCQPCGWWVSLARPPNRTCDFHRIRLSTCSTRGPRPWVRDFGAPVAVSLDGDAAGSEQVDSAVADLPVGEVATDHGACVQSCVSFAEPAVDTPEGVVFDVAEGPFGHAVTEVVAPAS